MRYEQRMLMDNGDVLTKTEDGLFFRASQRKNGLSDWQMLNQTFLPEEAKEMFHVEQKERNDGAEEIL